MIKAKIRFRDGSVLVCQGRVVNREGVPWTSFDDCKKHIASIEGLSIVEMWDSASGSEEPASPSSS